MGFSFDAKMIATLTGAPDWTAYLWIWDKAKIVASVKCVFNVPTQIKIKKDVNVNSHSSQVTESQDPSKSMSTTSKPNISSTLSVNANSSNDNKFQSTKNIEERTKLDYTHSALNTQIREISVNPTDQFQILVIGNQVFRLYKYLEGSLKQVPLPKIENRVFLE